MRRLILLLALAGAMLFAGTAVVMAEQTTPTKKETTTTDSKQQEGTESTSSQPKEDSSQPEEESTPGEILVKFKDNPSAQAKTDVHKEKGGQPKETLPKIGVDIVEVSEGQEDEKVAEYESDSQVEFAEKNGIWEAIDAEGTEPQKTKKKKAEKSKAKEAETGGAEAQALPNDPRAGQQYPFDNTGQTGGTNDADIDAKEAWDKTRGSSAVRIAVLDTGIDQNHEDLAGKIVLQRDFTGSASGVEDMQGHGTHVAGTAAAVSNNGKGVAGTCQECSLMNGKVLADNGNGSFDGIANGIVWAADNGAKVINMSLGSTTGSQTVENAVNYAWNKGVVVVAAAGNHGASTPFYPAFYGNVIAVANTDHNDAKNSSSGFGNWVNVAAPGTNILSTATNHPSGLFPSGPGYGTLTGTSMATPHVAGLGGLIWSNNGQCTTNTCVRQTIESKTDQISGTGTYWINGRVNAQKAVVGTQQQAIYEESDRSRATYAGWTWNESNPSFSGGYNAYNNTPGATTSIRFTGTYIDWRTIKAFESGITYVYLDGVFQKAFDAYSPTRQYNVVGYSRSGLSNTAHTLKLVNSGTKNARSSNRFTDLDRFVVGKPSSSSTTYTSYQENAPEVAYGQGSSLWSGTRWTGASGGAYRYSNSTLSPAARFNGFTGPDVYTRMWATPSGGWAKATITDASSGAVAKTQYLNLSASTAAWNWLYIGGLDQAKTYNLQLTSYNGNYVFVDAYYGRSASSGPSVAASSGNKRAGEGGAGS
jgi:thermitase